MALVFREGTVPAAIGMGLRLIGGYFVGGAMQSMLFGVRALDFSASASVPLILLACYVPARRAASLEPMRVPGRFAMQFASLNGVLFARPPSRLGHLRLSFNDLLQRP